MSNELLQQILSEIKAVKSEVSEIKTTQKSMDNRLTNIVEGQTRIEKKLNTVYDQTAGLTEFRTETNTKLDSIESNVNQINKDLSTIEFVTGKNMSDIALLKAVR